MTHRKLTTALSFHFVRDYHLHTSISYVDFGTTSSLERRSSSDPWPKSLFPCWRGTFVCEISFLIRKSAASKTTSEASFSSAESGFDRDGRSGVEPGAPRRSIGDESWSTWCDALKMEEYLHYVSYRDFRK